MAQGSWGGTGDTRVFKVNIVFKRALQTCMTGFHLRDVGINTLTPGDVVDLVKPWAQTQFIKCLSDQDDLVGVDAVNLATKLGAQFNFSNLHGTVGGDPAPSFLMVPVSMKGELRARYGQGRMLWPVAGEVSFFANVLSTSGISSYNDVVADFVDRFVGGTLFSTAKACNLHRAMDAHGSRPALPATWYDVTSLRLNTATSSLRRRKVGIGA